MTVGPWALLALGQALANDVPQAPPPDHDPLPPAAVIALEAGGGLACGATGFVGGGLGGGLVGLVVSLPITLAVKGDYNTWFTGTAIGAVTGGVLGAGWGTTGCVYAARRQGTRPIPLRKRIAAGTAIGWGASAAAGLGAWYVGQAHPASLGLMVLVPVLPVVGAMTAAHSGPYAGSRPTVSLEPVVGHATGLRLRARW